jgi:UDP-N-acetyl-D-glucosamine 4,6-dehydratase
MLDRKQDKILITGACGFVGQFLVKKLTESGYSNLILNCRNSERRSREYANIDLVYPGSIHSFFEENQPDHIVHLAAMARLSDGEQNPDDAFRTNFLGTKLLIEYAVNNGVKSFVFVSSDLVRNHQSVVGITKYMSEGFIQNMNISPTKFITLRLPNISRTPGSVHLIFERLINENKAITITHPDMSRRFIPGNEAAEYIQFVLSNGVDRDTFVVNKQPEKITELARKMISESGKDITISYIGMRPGEKLAEETYLDKEIEHTSFKDLALLKNNVPDSSSKTRAIKLLKSKPGFSLNL